MISSTPTSDHAAPGLKIIPEPERPRRKIQYVGEPLAPRDVDARTAQVVLGDSRRAAEEHRRALYAVTPAARERHRELAELFASKASKTIRLQELQLAQH